MSSKINEISRSSINDRASEPYDDNFSNYMRTENKNRSIRSGSSDNKNDQHHEGGELHTENMNVLDTDQLNNELLSDMDPSP